MKNINELSHKSVTGGQNGYPEPYLGQFHYGFDNIIEAKAFAEKHKCEVYTASWKDGWSYCALNGMAFQEFSADPEDYGNAARKIDSVEELKNDLAWYKEDYEKEDEAYTKYEQIEKEALEEAADINWEKECLIMGDDIWEVVQRTSMKFYHDTKHIAIGVFIEKKNEFAHEEG